MNEWEFLDGLANALRDVLDVATNWARPMTDAEKLEEIQAIAEAALKAAT